MPAPIFIPWLKPIVVRRLRRLEAALPASIQHHESYLPECYPKHEDWVKTAVRDIASGKRVAFGIFLGPDINFAGSAILKKGEYTDHIEIKNAIIDSDVITTVQSRDPDASRQAIYETLASTVDGLRKRLFAEIYLYAQKKGYRKLQIEIPPSQTDMISFLHHEGFNVSNVIGSRYKTGDVFYVLERRLDPMYSGDPFDFLDVVMWLLKKELPCFKVLPSGNVCSGELGDLGAFAHKLSLELYHPVEKGSDSCYERRLHQQTPARHLSLRGLCLIFDGDAPLTSDQLSPWNRESLFNNDETFAFVFVQTASEAVRKLCADIGARLVSDETLDALLGEDNRVYRAGFNKRDIGGFIVTLDDATYAQLQSAQRKRSRLAFFLFGGIGRHLEKAEELESGEDPHLLVFFVPHLGGYPKGAIVGYAAIEDRVVDKDRQELWDAMKEEGYECLLDKTEYLYFSSYSDDTDTVALGCNEIVLFNRRIDVDEFLSRTERLSGCKSISQKIEDTGAVKTYFPKSFAAELRHIAATQPSRVLSVTDMKELLDSNRLSRISGEKTENCTMDVVFVHGLGAGSHTNWAKDEQVDLFWPEWINKDYENIAVSVLGYNTSATEWEKRSMPLADLGIQVLEELHVNDIGARPVVFIAHSMGGLVVKQFLSHAMTQHVPRWRPIIENTCGIAFLSTPHFGANIASFVEFANVLLRTSDQVTDMTMHHERLRELHGTFLGLVAERRIIIRTYAERIPLKPEFELLGKKWKLPKGILVVDQTSAEPNIPNERAIPLDEDHLSICRPANRESAIYRYIGAFLKGNCSGTSCKTAA